MIFISACLYIFSIQIFLKQAQAFANGLSAIAIFITLITQSLESYFSIFYFVLNVPLIIFFWKRVRITFIYKTFFFLFAQLVLGFLFWIPSLNESLDDFFSNYNKDVWSGVFFASLAGVISGFAIGISWRYGGSCGGTDIIAYYYSTKRRKPVSAILFIVSTFFSIISITFAISFLEEQREDAFSRICSTFVFILISSMLVEQIYPKYSKIEINIHSSKIEKIVNYLKESNFHHAFQVHEFFSPYSKKHKKAIKTVVFLMEVKPLISKLKQIDPNIWVSGSKVINVWGKLSTKHVD